MDHGYDIPTGKLFLFGFLGTTVVVVISLSLMVLYRHTESRLQYERVTSQPITTLDSSLADQRTRLVEYQKTGVIEQDGESRGVYRIPIERSMEIVLGEWKSGVRPGPLPPGTTDASPAAEGTANEDS